MNPLVKKLEERLLPEFEKVAERIRQEIANVNVFVSSFPAGSDEYLAHGYCIECILTDKYYETDLVGLCVQLSHLVSVPKINADVCWSSGDIEAEFYKNCRSDADFPEVSDEILEDLYKDLPRLYDTLFEALKRRKPVDE